jgi:fatty acid desaturase
MRERLRGVEWRDLVPMRRIDGVVECLLPAPWLLGSWAFAAVGLWPVAAGFSFMFFLTALRLNHEAIHGNLGFSGRWHRWTLHGLSALMLGSNTSVAFNHLQHHAHLGTARDIEGKCGRMSGWRVLAYGPLFPIETHILAWRRGGPAIRRRMRVDLALNAAVVGAAAASVAAPLVYHVLVMAFAQCLTAFFAVWITHRHCHGDALVARTQRAPLINLVTYNMFLHLEHHLFPAVPVRRLGRLAARIDAAAPDIPARARRVVTIPWRADSKPSSTC